MGFNFLGKTSGLARMTSKFTSTTTQPFGSQSGSAANWPVTGTPAGDFTAYVWTSSADPAFSVGAGVASGGNWAPPTTRQIQGATSPTSTVSVLCVAGGGGGGDGGSYSSAGGGGAGGMRALTGVTFPATPQNIKISIGGGGTGGGSPGGGSESKVYSPEGDFVVASGGGGGAYSDSDSSGEPGGSGGGGGGHGAGHNGNEPTQIGETVASPDGYSPTVQGNDAGAGYVSVGGNNPARAGGSGGGAGAAGSNANSGDGGDGGQGASAPADMPVPASYGSPNPGSIGPSPGNRIFAGGGGGRGSSNGGIGGGGSGGSSANNGVANYGGGGGGTGFGGSGGDGGSGIVIVYFPA